MNELLLPLRLVESKLTKYYLCYVFGPRAVGKTTALEEICDYCKRLDASKGIDRQKLSKVAKRYNVILEEPAEVPLEKLEEVARKYNSTIIIDSSYHPEHFTIRKKLGVNRVVRCIPRTLLQAALYRRRMKNLEKKKLKKYSNDDLPFSFASRVVPEAVKTKSRKDGIKLIARFISAGHVERFLVTGGFPETIIKAKDASAKDKETYAKSLQGLSSVYEKIIVDFRQVVSERGLEDQLFDVIIGKKPVNRSDEDRLELIKTHLVIGVPAENRKRLITPVGPGALSAIVHEYFDVEDFSTIRTALAESAFSLHTYYLLGQFEHKRRLGGPFRYLQEHFVVEARYMDRKGNPKPVNLHVLVAPDITEDFLEPGHEFYVKLRKLVKLGYEEAVYPIVLTLHDPPVRYVAVKLESVDRDKHEAMWKKLYSGESPYLDVTYRKAVLLSLKELASAIPIRRLLHTY